MSKPLQDIQPETGDQETVSAPPMTFTELENKDYEMPSLDLLADPKHTGQQADKKNIYENARKLALIASGLKKILIEKSGLKYR